MSFAHLFSVGTGAISGDWFQPWRCSSLPIPKNSIIIYTHNLARVNPKPRNMFSNPHPITKNYPFIRYVLLCRGLAMETDRVNLSKPATLVISERLPVQGGCSDVSRSCSCMYCTLVLEHNNMLYVTGVKSFSSMKCRSWTRPAGHARCRTSYYSVRRIEFTIPCP